MNYGPNGRGRSSEPTLVSRIPVKAVAADERAAVAVPPPRLRDIFFVAALVFFGVCRWYRRRREQQQELRCEIGMADPYQEKFLLSDPSPSPDPPHGSGESRSLMKEVAHLVANNQDKLDFLKLMVIYRSSEKMLADILGATEEITLFYYHSSMSYKYHGRLRAENILSSVNHFQSLEPEELPLKLLQTPEGRGELFLSTDKAVLLLEFCGWSAKLLRRKNNGNYETPMSAFNHSENVGIIGQSINREMVDDFHVEHHKGMENRLTCAVEDGLGRSDWLKEYTLANQSALEQLDDGGGGTRMLCTDEEFKQFETFFMKFTAIAREFFLPPERQRVQQGDDLRNILQTHHSLIMEFDVDGHNPEPAFPANRPSIILFIDRSSNSSKVREESKLSLEVLRKFSVQNQLCYQTVRGRDSRVMGSSRSLSGSSSHQTGKVSQTPKVVKIKDNMAFMIVDEGEHISLKNTALESQGNPVYDILTRLLQRESPAVKNKETKISEVAKKAGFELLSDDFEVQIIESFQSHNDNNQLREMGRSTTTMLNDPNELTESQDDVSSGGLLYTTENIMMDERKQSEHPDDVANFLETREAAPYDNDNAFLCHVERSCWVEQELPTPKEHVQEEQADKIDSTSSIRQVKSDFGHSSSVLSAGDDMGSIRISNRLRKADEPCYQWQPFLGSFFFIDGGYRLLRTLTAESRIPSLVILDPVMQQHFVFSEATDINYPSVAFCGRIQGRETVLTALVTEVGTQMNGLNENLLVISGRWCLSEGRDGMGLAEVLLLLFLTLGPMGSTGAENTSTNLTFALSSNCPKSCGNISFEYPFGIGSGCCRAGFNLSCRSHSTDPPTRSLFLGDDTVEVIDFDMDNGIVYVKTPIVTMGVDEEYFNQTLIDLRNFPFSFKLAANFTTSFPNSLTSNEIFVSGCNAIADLVDLATKNTIDSCSTTCYPNSSSPHEYWSSGFCSIYIFNRNIVNLTTLGIQLTRRNLTNNHLINVSTIKAFMYSWRNFTSDNIEGIVNGTETQVAVTTLAYYITDHPTCKEANKNITIYACLSNNSDCYDVLPDTYHTNYTIGYICRCSLSYQGNPYIPNGCQDATTVPSLTNNCSTKCGDVNILFPFGLEKGCYRDQSFFLTCNKTTKPPILLFQHYYIVTNMSLEEGTLEVKRIYDDDYFSFAYENQPFIGLEEQIIMNWVITDQSCKDAKLNTITFACVDQHSSCNDKNISSNGQKISGYRCQCNDGYEGNPYLPNGCRDIDECSLPQKYVCYGTCTNTMGGYSCTCPPGSSGFPRQKACIPGKKHTLELGVIIGASNGVGLLLLSTGLIILRRKWKKRKQKRIRQKHFRQNHVDQASEGTSRNYSLEKEFMWSHYNPRKWIRSHTFRCCGNISIAYPFGIGNGCYRPGFDLSFIRPTTTSPKLFLGDGKTEVMKN
ncbi:hypothetical protein MUK42_27554 [Musa troglodytarum]|uniref:EGF-like domain-containing protein n=1 Tax=Musa troglodytarum TaxID=320322 RepID=A0A9E7EWB3_9LILI|nr:hypothetical protein MUK42_27554 [Musa troglodytarum]